MNILPSSYSQSISNEEVVILRHKFEDNVQAFFDLLSMSELREIELAMAKLLDAINSSSDDYGKLLLLFKVSLIRSYHTMRQNGERNLKKVKRWLNGSKYTVPLTYQLIDFLIVPRALKIAEVLSNEKALEVAKKYSS